MEDVHIMSIEDFAEYLSDSYFDDDLVDVLRKNKISGTTFMKLSERQMEKMIPAVGDVVELRELQERLISQV